MKKTILILTFISITFAFVLSGADINKSKLLEEYNKLYTGTANGAIFLTNKSKDETYFTLDFQGSKAKFEIWAETEGCQLTGITTSEKSEFYVCFGGEAAGEDKEGTWNEYFGVKYKNKEFYSDARISRSYDLIIKKGEDKEYWIYRITKKIKLVTDKKDELFIQPDSTIMFCLSTKSKSGVLKNK